MSDQYLNQHAIIQHLQAYTNHILKNNSADPYGDIVELAQQDAKEPNISRVYKAEDWDTQNNNMIDENPSNGSQSQMTNKYGGAIWIEWQWATKTNVSTNRFRL